MSGTQSALFGGGSRWITNPKHLNLIVNADNRTQLKTAVGGMANASAAGFYTGMGHRGAQASISVANTYVTLANLTGAGFLFNAVAPMHSAGYTPTMRITVDGVEYLITSSTPLATATRLVLGPLMPGGTTAAVASASLAGDIIGPNSPHDAGFKVDRVAGIAQGDSTTYFSLMTPEVILSLNMQCLRFEQSLKVEMKSDLLSAVAVDKQCGVTYRLDL